MRSAFGRMTPHYKRWARCNLCGKGVWHASSLESGTCQCGQGTEIGDFDPRSFTLVKPGLLFVVDEQLDSFRSA